MSYYLKPNIKAEPLISSWYCWSHLISPLTCGCHTAFRHMPTLKSFVDAPTYHEEAAKMASLMGGPFVNLTQDKVIEIKALLDKTIKVQGPLIQLAKDYKAFLSYLFEHADGSSLEPFYTSIPDSLRGMVELSYVGNTTPQIRLIEQLIYAHYYDDSNQQVHLCEVNDDKRPFLLNTPRIDFSEGTLINQPFSNAAYDVLYSSRRQGVSLDKLIDLLHIPNQAVEAFKSLFTVQKPELPPDRNYTGPDVRVRYFGHACILLETAKTSILIDPFISYHYNTNLPRFTFSDLPDKIDYVLITHNHQDHIQLETLLQLRHKVENILVPRHRVGSLFDPSLKLILEHLGFPSVTLLDEFSAISLPDGSIVGLPFLGEHGDFNILSKQAYFISLKEKRFLFAADSNNLDPQLYHHIINMLGSIDVAFIGMECKGAPASWIYGPLLTKKLPRKHDLSRRLSGSDATKALQLIKSIQCKEAYIYAMGQEPWLSFIMGMSCQSDSPPIIESDKFLNYCKNDKIKSKRLYGKEELIYS